MRELFEVLQKITYGVYETSRDTLIRGAYIVRDTDVEDIPVLSEIDWFIRGLSSCVYNEGLLMTTTVVDGIASCYPQYQLLIEDD